MTQRTNGPDIVASAACGRLDRRQFHRLLVGAGLMPIALPILAAPAAAEVNLTVYDWTGYEDPSLHPEFAAKYGGEPQFSVYADEEEALAKMRGGFRVDVSHPCSANVQRWRDAGVIKPIDTARIPRWKDILPQLLKVNGIERDGQTWAMPWDWGYSVIGYNTDELKVDAPTFDLLLAPETAGKVAMNAQFDVALAVAAVIGGFADLFKPTPAEMERLPDLWRRLVGQSRLLWNDRTEAEQAFASGEAVIGYLWFDSVRTLRSQGVPIAVVPPLLTWVCGYALNADAPGSEDQAYDFLNALLDPAAGKVLIEWGYGHANRESFALADPSIVKELGFGDIDAFFAQGRFFDEVDKANRNALIELWNKAQAGL